MNLRTSVAVLPPRLRLKALLLRAAEPVSLFGTGFQRRCVQQALFLMLRNPSFVPCAVEVGMALERAMESMRHPHFIVFLRALHPEFGVARALLDNPVAKDALLAATFRRATALLDERKQDTALVGNLFHFLHSRAVGPRFRPTTDRMLDMLNKAAAIEGPTWVAFFTWVHPFPFDRRVRTLLARFREECPAVALQLSPAQLQTLLFALASIIERYPRGGDTIKATLAALTLHASDMPAKHLVACAYSAHLANVAAGDFLRRVMPHVVEELGTLTQWELLHLVVAYDAALQPVPETDAWWHALFAESRARLGHVDAEVNVALLARFAASPLPPLARTEATRWCEETIEQMLGLPPTSWRLRELGRLRDAAHHLQPSASVVSRLQQAAEQHLPPRKVAERAAVAAMTST